MEKISKQHVAVVTELTTKHHIQIKDFNDKIAAYIEQDNENETALAELSMKLSDADCSFMELKMFVQEEPTRQQEAIRRAEVGRWLGREGWNYSKYYVFIYLCAYVYVCMGVIGCVCTCMYMVVYIYVYIYVYICVYVCMTWYGT